MQYLSQNPTEQISIDDLAARFYISKYHMMRRFRDETLAATWYGRAFIRCYYAVSPTLVRLFGGQRWFRAVWKPRLDGMVRRLNGQGVADTPYQDRPW